MQIPIDSLDPERVECAGNLFIVSSVVAAA